MIAVFGPVVFLLLCLPAACRRQVRTASIRPTSTSILTATWTPASTGTPALPASPAPTPVRLTDAEAVASIEEQIVARRVASDTVRVKMLTDPRAASIRYSSSYSVDSGVFRAETVLITLEVARIVAAVDPPVTEGIRLAVVPDGEGDIGLLVTVIEGPSLEAWVDGSLSDGEFVGQWTVVAATRE